MDTTSPEALVNQKNEPIEDTRPQQRVVTVRMPQELHDRITNAKHECQVSMNTLAVKCLEYYVERIETEVARRHADAASQRDGHSEADGSVGTLEEAFREQEPDQVSQV